MRTTKINPSIAERALELTQTLEEAFPAVDPGIKPCGSRVLVQLRTPRRKTSGGIILTDETRETDKYGTQVAKVVLLGPLAFKNRDTMVDWVEGAWCKAGDFVRVPRYGGDRFTVTLPTGEEGVFCVHNDMDIVGIVTGDPLQIQGFYY